MGGFGWIRERVMPVAEDVVSEVREQNVTFIAGSIAYSAFVSLLPLLLLLAFVASAVGDDTLRQDVLKLTNSFLLRGKSELLAGALSNASARAGASIVGVVTLLWGTLKVFRGFDTAFSEIYDSERESTLVDQVRDGFVVLLAIGLAIAAAVVVGAVFALYEHVPFIGVVNPLLLVVGLIVAFFPMFYVFPDADLTPREVLPGAVFAAIGWAALQVVFQAYVSFADKYEVYGVIGSVLLLLTWLYFSGLVVLVGAVINAVLSGYAETSAPSEPADEQQPKPGAPTGGSDEEAWSDGTAEYGENTRS